MKTKIVFSEKCLNYGGWHIEGPQRVKMAHEFLKEKKHEFLEPTSASEEDVLRVHDADYVWKLKKGLVEDPDTPAYENIYEHARLSAGGAILAAKVNGFSLMRPPGHHAGRSGAALGVYTRGRWMMYCYWTCTPAFYFVIDWSWHSGQLRSPSAGATGSGASVV